MRFVLSILVITTKILLPLDKGEKANFVAAMVREFHSIE